MQRHFMTRQVVPVAKGFMAETALKAAAGHVTADVRVSPARRLEAPLTAGERAHVRPADVMHVHVLLQHTVVCV